MPHLTVLNGPLHGRIVPVTETAVFRLGRDPALELSLDDYKVSRVHFEIEYKSNQYVLRDLRSKNGTLVNGSRVSTLVLKEGDQIQAGETRLAFSLQESPSAHQGDHYDSVMAPRLPVGAVPALGNAGVTGGKDSAEGFETIELDAELPLLRMDGGVRASPSGSSSRAETPARLERANRSLKALFSIARACAESKSTRQLLTLLAARLRTALEADRVTPILLDDDERWHVAEIDADPEASKEDSRGPKPAAFSRVPVSRTIVDYAQRTRRSVLTSPKTDERFGTARSIGEQGITSALCVPVLVGERIHGLIYADRLGGESFDRDDHELLTAACLQAGPALAQLKALESALERKERLLGELKSQHKMYGESPQMKEVYAFIERAAPTESVVLVLGESGTGKELVARAIHYNSPRSEGPMIVVNCAALSESLIESELFGHAKGAFTGATADRKGCFESAHEGTIFLDEIGELSAACQTKLLRVIEQGEVTRVGENRVRKVDVRLIAATNRDLGAEAKAGRFREDLFYRLNVLSIELPLLRERGDDILLLAEHYLNDAAKRSARPSLRFSEEASERLKAYGWPGNVRELRNVTERLAVLCPSEVIGVRELPVEVQRAGAAGEETTAGMAAPAASSAVKPAAAQRQLADVEKEHILRTLEAAGGNKKQAAEILGIDRSTLYAKLRAYGILGK
ncbi:MAG: sigma 54-interacting transcriptional regulator [Planctomycetes bacterium]|nr:sigma 54-interacting transcriptional regulator [Planctomycetota bacterium]